MGTTVRGFTYEQVAGTIDHSPLDDLVAHANG